MATKDDKQEKGKEIVYHFVGDGSQVISDAPSEDITEEMWQQLPKHVQRSIAGSRLYKRGQGDDGSDDDDKDRRKSARKTAAQRKPVTAEPKAAVVVIEERKPEPKSDKAE